MIRIQSHHEKLFQERLIRNFTDLGIVARHWEPEISAPDLWIFGPSHYLVAELKSVEKLTKRKFGSLFEDGQLPWIARHKRLGMNVCALIEVREQGMVILFNPSDPREVEESFDLTIREMADIYPCLGLNGLEGKLL